MEDNTTSSSDSSKLDKISSLWFQAKRYATSGLFLWKCETGTTGICIPGEYFPILSFVVSQIKLIVFSFKGKLLYMVF